MGKSSLINSFLGGTYLPEGRLAAKTGAIIEVSHWSKREYHATIYFRAADEWDNRLPQAEPSPTQEREDLNEQMGGMTLRESEDNRLEQEIRALFGISEGKIPYRSHYSLDALKKQREDWVQWVHTGFHSLTNEDPRLLFKELQQFIAIGGRMRQGAGHW